ncbi:hypothetical protein ACFY05_42110 [Microtetraspora fusca]|uniref:DUF222 domain-containing protein n=1 Tax=Microtetraspora fusca TaxID=1997 RepID=A0ABW6VJ93_MICFU
MTSNEIALREQRAEIDSWVDMIRPVGQLAADLAQTEFVPDSLRGRTAAVAAAILTGREMGVGPMVALRHIHVIKGNPGQSAELMRALVLAQGHQIRYPETTDTRCVVEGRRRGEEDWTRVMFTADQAKRAKIDLGGYPEDKLVARATARLCRRIFTDVIAGMPYTTDELEDLDGATAVEPVDAAAAGSVGQAEPKRRTARRRTAAAAPAEPASAPPAEASVTAVSPQEARQAPRAQVPEPPLPGEPGYEEPPGEKEQTEEPPAPETLTRPQSRKIHALFNEIGWTDRADRLRASSTIVDRELKSSGDLTKDEAAVLIDMLERVAAGPDPAMRLGDLLAEIRDGAADPDGDEDLVDDGEPVDAEIVDGPESEDQ